MAKLLSTAQWPEDGKEYPEYPVEFNIVVESKAESGKGAKPSDWLNCELVVNIRRTTGSDTEVQFKSKTQILRRDLARLSGDLKALLQQGQMTSLTFVPVTPSFELWIQHLSDEQYRAIVWHDLADAFHGAYNIAHQGVRFTTNRTRLMGFARSLDSDIQGES